VSKETLYRHYPSKDQLLAAVLRDIAVDGAFTEALPALPNPADRAGADRVGHRDRGADRDLSLRNAGAVATQRSRAPSPTFGDPSTT
jgi:AcrR family transcriptional regulator